ncbi:DUF551 domain-containing protein, partial [Escherichia coli]|nr:DUF551 domain-containing protein [Escherichia coli]EGK5016759.1 DUF551 domain-containing protein [Escherichia coli]EGK5771088.1 DUF551 domain-containing protein [Escherichia coli]EGK5896272.1 DUF551 domain-containing protein [Escherichia coli]EGK6006011.1 DUF551 domain-containing protein [Escherichia coli]
MTTITKERLLTIKQWRETYGPGSNVVLPAEEAEELARIALESLEAEAVMFCISGQNVDSEEHVSTSKAVVDAWVEEWNQVDGSPGEPLYKTMPLYYHAALPAPVVPEEATPENVEMLSGYVSTYKLTDSERDIAAEIWNACRAAMLQGSQPVSQTYKFPVNTPCQDAPAHIWLQTAGVWPEDGELSELTWCSHNQHHDDTLYVRADLVNGNSPVTPDGWISCSERMPEKYDFDIWVFSPSRGVLDGLQWDGSMFTDDEYQFVIHDATHW